jgi:hypothetical protein
LEKRVLFEFQGQLSFLNHPSQTFGGLPVKYYQGWSETALPEKVLRLHSYVDLLARARLNSTRSTFEPVWADEGFAKAKCTPDIRRDDRLIHIRNKPGWVLLLHHLLSVLS